MSAEACEKFFGEKYAQTKKAYAERYAATIGQAPVGAIDWAREHQPELHRKLKAAEEELDALWKAGTFGEDFKQQVLTYFRTMLEIWRLYHPHIGKRGE